MAKAVTLSRALGQCHSTSGGGTALEYYRLSNVVKFPLFFGATVLALLLSACTTDVLPCGPDTYTITSGGAGFSDAGVRTRVLTKANDFCTQRGLVMVPVSMDSERGVYGKKAPNATLVFRALRPGDPDIKRPNVEGPNSIVRLQVR